MCVWGDAIETNTNTTPMYGCVLTVTAPQSYMGHTRSMTLTRTMPSWDLPAAVDMEDAWYDSPPPNMVHGDSKEVHVDICITKLNVDH